MAKRVSDDGEYLRWLAGVQHGVTDFVLSSADSAGWVICSACLNHRVWWESPDNVPPRIKIERLPELLARRPETAHYVCCNYDLRNAVDPHQFIPRDPPIES